METYSHTVETRPRSFWRNRLAAIDRGHLGADLWQVEIAPDALEVTLDSTRGMHGRKEKWAVVWDAIFKVEALLLDCFSYDTIWIRVLTQDKQTVEFPEDAGGFRALVESLPTKLSGCEPFSEWYQRTAQPPLVEKCISIFTKGTHAV